MKQMVTDTSRNSGAINDHTKAQSNHAHMTSTQVCHAYSLEPFTLL